MVYLKVLPLYLTKLSISWTIILSCLSVNAQQVTLLADDAYPPYSYIENGQAKGIYVELINKAAEKLKPYYQIKIVAVPWKRGLKALETGSAFALFPPYRHIEKRPYIWPYSIAMLSETVVAFCYKDIELSSYIYKDLENLPQPLNIGINAGYEILNKELQIAKAKGTIKVWENKDTRSNIIKLLRKRLDCYINDRFSTLWELKHLRQSSSNNELNFNEISEMLVVMTQTAHIGYSDSKNHKYPFKEDFIKRMDEALSSLYNSEDYNHILADYIEP